MDVAVSAVRDSADVAVQTDVETSDSSTVHDPPIGSPPVASSLAADVPEVVEPVVDQPDLPSASSTEILLDIPEDFSVGGSLSVGSDPDDAVPAPETGSGETSPMRPSFIDCDNEPIASRLPGYLNSFKTCEVSDQQFLPFVFFLSSLSFFAWQFRFTYLFIYFSSF